QPVVYNIIFRIRDIVNCVAPPVYQKTQTTDSLHPIRLGGVTKAHTDTITFDPYVTNAQLVRQAGRFRAEVIATDRGPSGEVYGDVWPFDDTTGVRIFGIFRQEVPYITTFSDFSVSCEDGIIPNVRRWVSIGSQVVDGDQNTWNPPPPRGPASGSNGNITLQSPVTKMDRQTVEGAYYPGAGKGDTIISFPVNIASAVSPTIYVNYQRAGKKTYDRGWSDQVRIGPEHAVYNTLKTGFFQTPDILMVEFAEPSPNAIDNITNVRSWRNTAFGDPTGAPRWGADAPRWGVFGGGGGSGRDTIGRIVVDEFDAGKDFEFYRAYIPVPVRWSQNINTNKTFRFRLRVSANDNRDPIIPADDEDAFFVDNIYLTTIDKPELEVSAVGARWPYSIAPASQARAIPLYVKVANNGSTAATAFGVAMYVQPAAAQVPGTYKYYRFRSVISLGAGRDRTEFFPTWNAQECGTEIINPNPTVLNSMTYRITGELLPKGLDAYSANDLNYNDFTLTLGSVFAYDDTSRRQGRNDVPQFSGTFGKGLNLVPPAEDPLAQQPYGPVGGNLAGSFAVRFDIQSRDTINGFQAYFGSANQSPDYILYSLYRGSDANPNGPPDTVIVATRRFARRGEGTPTFPPTLPREFNWDQYVTYALDTPYVVDPGTYFITISQLGETGLELGGSSRRQGQVTTIYDPNSNPLGIGNYSIPAHPEMFEQRFWFETIAETGNWSEMLQPTTNPGFPHLNYGGVVAVINTFTRGSWIPMVRPYFGPKESGSCTVEPVELKSFEVTALPNALRLDWATASEVDNKGFHVERRIKSSDDSWNAITFVQGAGTSNREREYAVNDVDVKQDVTYQYRLRQEDRDGSVNYSGVREGRLAGATTGAIANRLEQNTPNPVSNSTSIGFSIADGGAATLAIVDMYGRTVRSFNVNGNGSVNWDGLDGNGKLVANGVYVYKLDGEGYSISKKLTVTR
ncbi:MAG: T9SS type A sorting domain-containing protein, partial [bacterium]|nr:T9SS type A sorting domain-containing protein [Candidatus Kapabacteria bacterium]